MTRREFLESSGKAAFALAFLDTSIKYGFTTETTLARRQPIAGGELVKDSYQEGALLRFRQTIGDDGQTWLKIVNDANIHNRAKPLAHGDIFILPDKIKPLTSSDLTDIHPEVAPDNKVIDINLTIPQTLTAYENDQVFLTSKATAGMRVGWTPTGEFKIRYYLLARYMQGYDFDLPGVPFDSCFDVKKGIFIHGAYWRKTFGRPGSHGCVNLETSAANLIWRWSNIGTRVIIHY